MTLESSRWADLVIEIDGSTPCAEWMKPWAGLVRGQVATRFLNRFGCWFLEHPDGAIDLLDVFFGQLERVADSPAAFQTMIQDPAWQQVYLFSKTVDALHSLGAVASGTSCYAIAPHPAVGGPDPWASERLDPAAIMVMDVGGWQALCAQFVRLAREA